MSVFMSNSPARGAAVGQHVRVREFGALRRSGGPRRVEQDRCVGGLALHHLEHWVGLEERLLELARNDRDRFAAGCGRGGIGLRGEVVPDQQQTRVAVAQVVLDLATLVQHVQRHDDGARAQDPVVGDDEVRDVGDHQRHAVARSHAVLTQNPGHPHRRLLEQAVAQGEVVELDRDPLGIALRGVGQDLGEVHAGRSPPSISRR